MERLDYYDILPKGMDAYLSAHGHHFSKAMYEWAVGMMKDMNGKRVQPIDKQRLDNALAGNGVTLKHMEGYYDPMYVWCMATSDYLGSSISDEMHLARFVFDYMEDPDGNPTRAFDEFYVNCLAKGIDIPWEDMI